jgi:hypothetical protein
MPRHRSRDLRNRAQGHAPCSGNKEHKLQADDGALAGARAGIVWYTKAKADAFKGSASETRASRATNSERRSGLVPVVHVSKASLPACSARPVQRNSEPPCTLAAVTCVASPRGRRTRSPGAAREQATRADWVQELTKHGMRDPSTPLLVRVHTNGGLCLSGTDKAQARHRRRRRHRHRHRLRDLHSDQSST